MSSGPTPDVVVGIDTSPLALTRAGTARYVNGLLGAFPDTVRVRRLAFSAAGRAAVPVRDVGWYLAALPLAARRLGVDVLHCPTFRAPARSPLPLVVTVHDLAVLRHPQVFNGWTRHYTRTVLPHVLRTARRVIAVSEFTAAELVELTGTPRGKIRVVRHGVGLPFCPAGDASPGDYVLAVGTLEPRKNLHRLVQAFEDAPPSGCELRIVGAAGWGGVRIGGRRVRMLGEVDDDELARLYRGARCVAYLSLYEGFGLPVLEAMACGAPVVVSQAAALREVAGAAAVVVDGLDPVSIGRGLAEAIARREELAAAGIERAAAFTWATAGRETAEVYREAGG